MTSQPPFANAAVTGSLGQKLAQFVRLSPDEAAAVEALQSGTRVVRHNREIIVQGRKYDALLVMIEGIAVRYRILRDGRRQVLNIALPGDLIGFPACFFEAAPYSINALSDTVLGCVPFPALGELFHRHPRIAAAILWTGSAEAAIYIEHLTDVGRRSALERVAHFLLELLVRCRTVGLGDDHSFPMPLTQELIADAMGLSVPHVNRMLRQLRDDDLVRIEAHQVIVKDADALSALADFDKSYLVRFRALDMFNGVRKREAAVPPPPYPAPGHEIPASIND